MHWGISREVLDLEEEVEAEAETEEEEMDFFSQVMMS
jgi:hypothetical protein